MPLPAGDALVIAIPGGWERWTDEQRIAQGVARRISDHKLPSVHVEVVENHRLHLARKLILKAFDRNQNGKLDAGERSSARIVIFGQSLGGSATVRLCRWLQSREIPVLLSVQVDSVGLNDAVIPPNVHAAANLYQRDLGPIRGEPEIRAQDPRKTTILGNWRYTYPATEPLPEQETLARRIFSNPHLRMEADRAVWDRLESLVVEALKLH